MNYADYFIFVLKHDNVLLELYNKGIITANTSPSHKWIEYRTENNRYIIDPTWCDWDYVGQPVGIYANNAAFAEACRTSFNRDKLIEAKSRSWFFRNVKTITEEFDKRAHGL
jgi:bifunctional ADP-heptose synthase (sugar kinase/adenylyltransferase)